MRNEMDKDASDASDNHPDDGLPLVELETLLSRPPSRRKRLAQIGLVLAALAVTAATFWSLVVPRPPAASAPFGPPDPYIAPTPSPVALVIESNVNAGTVTLNGKPLGSLPRVLVRRPPAPPYVVTVDAPPFRPISCQFPSAASPGPQTFSQCKFISGFLPNNSAPARYLSVLFSINDLPADQQRQITALVQQPALLQQQAAVPPGSTIATRVAPDGAITSQQTTMPLSASAAMVPGAPAAQASPFCDATFCYNDGRIGAAAGSGFSWVFAVPIVGLRWRFSGAGGQVVSEVSFPVGGQVTLRLDYAPATGWQVARSALADNLAYQFPNLACAAGVFNAQLRVTGAGWTISIVHNQGIAGCEFALQQNNVNEGRVVWRFGVLLAANATAHSTLPALPIATPAEIAAVGG